METQSRQDREALENSIAALASISWWRQEARAVWALAPRFLPPAASLTIANVIGVLAMGSLTPLMTLSDASQTVIQSAFWCLIGVVLSLILSLWALTSWLFSLTAFSRAAIRFSGRPNVEQFDRAALELRQKAGYLARVWLVASGYLTVPVVPLAVLIAVKIVSSSGMLEQVGLQSIAIPDWMNILIVPAIAALAIITAAYTFILLVVSSRLSRTALDANHETIAICAKRWKPVLVVTALVLLANLALASPESVDADLSQRTVWLQIAVQFWLGAVSLIAWPLTIAPYCLIVAAWHKGPSGQGPSK